MILSNIYSRVIILFGCKENINNSLFFCKEKLKYFKLTKIKKVIYSVEIFDKMIKLITKIVLVNSKFFFLNNVKFNYTLLKFCDKKMKLVNLILLFCLLCDVNIPYYCFILVNLKSFNFSLQKNNELLIFSLQPNKIITRE